MGLACKAVLKQVLPLKSHFSSDCYQGHMTVYLSANRPWLTYHTYGNESPHLFRYPIRVGTPEERRIYAFYQHARHKGIDLTDFPDVIYALYRDLSVKKLSDSMGQLIKENRKYTNSTAMTTLARCHELRFVPDVNKLIRKLYMDQDAEKSLRPPYIQAECSRLIPKRPRTPAVLYDPMYGTARPTPKYALALQEAKRDTLIDPDPVSKLIGADHYWRAKPLEDSSPTQNSNPKQDQ